MKLKFKKELKPSNDLDIGDQFKIGGCLVTVVKVENIFQYVPDSQIRLTLKMVGATSKHENAVIFLPIGMPITILR